MQNFGKIKNGFNSLLGDMLVSKNVKSKELMKQYLKSINECEILKTQCLVYINMENKFEPNENKAIHFIRENIDLFARFNKKEIAKANSKLVDPILTENNKIYGDEELRGNEELHENISKLIFTKKTPENIETIVEATDKIVNYIKNNKIKEVNESIDLPSNLLTTIMVDKFNEKYSDLSENDKTIFKTIMESNDEQKKTIYSSTIRECIDLIDTKIVGSDLEVKDRLLKVKDKLLSDKEDLNENTFPRKISKLIELRNSLN